MSLPGDRTGGTELVSQAEQRHGELLTDDIAVVVDWIPDFGRQKQ